MSIQHRDNSVVVDDNNTKTGGPYVFVQTCNSSLDPKTLYFNKVFGWTVAFFFNLVLWITMNPNWHQGPCFCVNLA